MTEKNQKYSLWLSPKGEEAKPISALIAQLADQNNAPTFIPHISLAGHILANDKELIIVEETINKLAASVEAFTVSLTQYGFMNEEHRCLYLLAESPQLDDLYVQASEYFPQIEQEHFKRMPHLSVMYGNYSDEVKQNLIDYHPFGSISFQISSIDLCLTEGSESDWHSVYSADLLPST